MLWAFAYRDPVALRRLYLDQLPVLRSRIVDGMGRLEELKAVLLCGDDLSVPSRILRTFPTAS